MPGWILLLVAQLASSAKEAACSAGSGACDAQEVAQDINFLQRGFSAQDAEPSGWGHEAPSCTPGFGAGLHLVQLPEIKRQFLLAVPPEFAHSATGVPLVISFHGSAESAWYHNAAMGFARKIDRYGWLGMLPFGQNTTAGVDGYGGLHECCSTLCNGSTECCENGSQMSTHADGCFWETGAPNALGQEPLQHGPKQIAFVKAMIAWATQRSCTDVSKVFAMGWSSGGDMSNFVACQLPHLFKAVAPMGIGMMPETVPHLTCQPKHPLTYISFCGSGDEVSGCAATSRLLAEAWSHGMNCYGQGPWGAPITEQRSATATCIKWEKCDGGNFVENCYSEGQDHNPSGVLRPEGSSILRPASDLRWPEYVFERFSLLAGDAILFYGSPNEQELAEKHSAFPPPKRDDHSYLRNE